MAGRWGRALRPVPALNTQYPPIVSGILSMQYTAAAYIVQAALQQGSRGGAAHYARECGPQSINRFYRMPGLGD